ncbi:motile sperm domain-containing protein 1-like [Homarus americanus]|nr:motile sperm domain-containing protein 1-like [Homarus americanus]XP_042238925.1 motile sperm domain-containing protein 1-like [Homarus americanus]XP_042238926.1 motile sperm domain-containing protein 1-like [Homarus americanus]
MQPSGLDGRLPVFVFPQSLTFYVADQTTHKQIVTLYNPYDFRISYSVLCNNPSCFTVDSPKGFVRAKCSLDIIITRINLSLSDASDRDRFRIQISEDEKRQVLGKKDVPAVLLSGTPEPRSGSDSDQFESVRAPTHHGAVGGAIGSQLLPQQRQQPFGTYQGSTGPSLVLVAAAVVCLVGLLMPTEGDQTPTRIPSYLHLNSNIKIVIAYVLGLLTYALLRAG